MYMGLNAQGTWPHRKRIRPTIVTEAETMAERSPEVSVGSAVHFFEPRKMRLPYLEGRGRAARRVASRNAPQLHHRYLTTLPPPAIVSTVAATSDQWRLQHPTNGDYNIRKNGDYNFRPMATTSLSTASTSAQGRLDQTSGNYIRPMATTSDQRRLHPTNGDYI